MRDAIEYTAIVALGGIALTLIIVFWLGLGEVFQPINSALGR